MLHERNAESVRYFKEDEEAAFFETPDEMVERISYYLENPEHRAQVAKNGYERCIKSGYRLDDRMQHVLSWFDNHISAAINPVSERAEADNVRV